MAPKIIDIDKLDEDFKKLCQRYDINTVEELNDKIAQIADTLQPFIDHLILQMKKLQEAITEFWNAIPDELKEAIAEAEVDMDDPEGEWEEKEAIAEFDTDYCEHEFVKIPDWDTRCIHCDEPGIE